MELEGLEIDPSMLRALTESRERQARLVTDAGHELRTPLSRMNLALELLEQVDLDVGRLVSDLELEPDQIEAGDGFGHPRFDRHQRVHLHEPEPVSAQPVCPIHDEFDCASAGVSDGLGRRDRRLPHGCAHRVGHPRRGGFLNDFLVAALG